MLMRIALIATFTLVAHTAEAKRDWFVREGSSGDGSQKSPFGDPWQALEKCEAGDAIHVTEGKYYGKLGVGMWKIPFDGVQLIGGYDKEFKHRDPWKDRTELLWDKDSKNRANDTRLMSNAKNTVVDGITIDMQDQNGYVDADRTGRTGIPIGEAAMRFTQPVTIRNSVIVNPGRTGIEATPGSTIENNLVLNALGWGVNIYTSTGDFAKMTATVKNNTILFPQDEKKPGAGGYDGAAIAVKGPANITSNILAHCDNNAIYNVYNPEKVSITKNVFYLNLHSNVKFYFESRDVVIDDKQMDMLEEVGFKAYDGNIVANPKLPYDKDWIDQFSKRTAAQPGKVEMDDWNKVREILGQPVIATGGKMPEGMAPAYDWKDAIDTFPKNTKVKAGARAKDLPVKFEGVDRPEEAAQEYVEVDWETAKDKDAWQKLDGKRVAIKIAIKTTDNLYQLDDIKKDQYACFMVGGPTGEEPGLPLRAYVKKGTAYERVMRKAKGYTTGKPEESHVLKGVARGNRQLVTEIIERAD